MRLVRRSAAKVCASFRPSAPHRCEIVRHTTSATLLRRTDLLAKALQLIGEITILTFDIFFEIVVLADGDRSKHETRDPNQFWVECDGEGEIRYPDYPVGTYRNHFIHSFELEDGRIRRNREFMNPFRQLRALGIEVPEVRRGGIPT